MAAKKNEPVEEAQEELSVEEIFEEIESRIRILDNEDATLEEAFKAYREGMEYIRACDRSIERIETRVKKIAEDGTLEDM